MNGLLASVVTCSVTMGIVTLLALAASPLLERRYTRGAIYALWLAVALGFLVPVRPSLPQKPAVTVQVPRAMSEPVRIAPQREAMPVVSGTPVQTQQAQQTAAAPRARITPVQMIAAIWLLGAAATLLAQLMRHARFMRTVRRWRRPVADEAVLAAYEKACKDICVRRAPELYTCALVTSPMLAGLLRPCILLPQDVPEGNALCLVLRHELTHHKRGDLPLRAMLLLARAMHWFNPAAYVCERMAVYYGELSCDERAVRGTDRDQRAAYGGAIIDALRVGRGAQSLLTTGLSADKRLLKKRLIAMMDMRMKRRGAFAAVLALGLSALLGANLVLADAKAGKLPEGADYGPEAVLATQVLEGEQTGGATVIVHDAYYDGYLLKISATLSPNAEGEGVYNDVVFGDGEPKRGELERDGFVPVGVYCESTAFEREEDRDNHEAWLYPTRGFGDIAGLSVDRTDIYYFPPDAPGDDLTVNFTVGLMETPGEILDSTGASRHVLVEVPAREVTTRSAQLSPAYELLSRLRRIFVAETDELANVFLYYEDDAYAGCPVKFVGENADEEWKVRTEFDETLGLEYRWHAIDKDGPLDAVYVKDGFGQVYAIDLNTGDVTLTDIDMSRVPDGVTYGPEAVTASYVLEDEAIGSATITVHDVHNDGYLMLANVSMTPNSEDSAVYDTSLLGDEGPWMDTYAANGLNPIGVYCGVSVLDEDANRLDSRWSGTIRPIDHENRGWERVIAFVFPPDQPMGDLIADVGIGLSKPGSDKVVFDRVPLDVPLTARAATRSVDLAPESEALTGLKRVVVAESGPIAGVYLCYDTAHFTGDFADRDSENDPIAPVTGYAESFGMNYYYDAFYTDAPLDAVHVKGWTGQVYAIDLSTGEVTLEELDEISAAAGGTNDGQKAVLASHVLEGAQSGGTTVTVHDVYNDGYLLLADVSLLPNAENEAVYDYRLQGPTGPWIDSYEANGWEPIGVSAQMLARREDGTWLMQGEDGSIPSASAAVIQAMRGVEKLLYYVLPPDSPEGDVTLQLLTSLHESPGVRLHDGEQEGLTVNAPAMASDAYSVELSTESGAPAGLKRVFVTRTDWITGVYLCYDTENCPVGFAEDDARIGSVSPQTGYAETLGMNYCYGAFYTDALGDAVRVTDDAGKTYEIDL